MTKRRGEDTDQVKVKQRVEFRDDGGQEGDVEMDLPSVQGPSVPLGLSPRPPTGQVASDDELAVPGEPRSRMVRDQRKPDDHTTLDAEILSTFSTSMPLKTLGRTGRGVLLGVLDTIAQQNNCDDNIGNTMFTQYAWLQGFLTDQWEERSFTKARRLEILQPTSILPSSSEEDTAYIRV